MSGIEVRLDDVPETLLLPLWGRAALTRSGNRILSDPAAVEIVDRLQYDFSKIAADLDYSKNLTWIARARQLDDVIAGFASRQPGCTVVNLGAGLDTTFSRVDDGRMLWVDLDLPEVVAIRRRLVPERERARCVAATLLEPAWMDRVEAAPEGTLFVAAGVLFYFTEAQVKDLLRGMAGRYPGAELAFDAMSPRAVERVNCMLERVGMEGAVMRWGLGDAKVLETWGAGLTVLDQYEYFRGLDLAGIPLSARIMTLVNRVLRVMTIVHCRWR